MSALSQNFRQVKVFTVLPENTLLFSEMSGSEQLSQLFEYRLRLVSESSSIDLDSLLGTEINVSVELPVSDYVPLNSFRYFQGTIAACSQLSSEDEFSHYEFTVRPWVWLLTRSADCKVFQDLTVPDIITQVLNDYGFTFFELRLSGNYEMWRYCVQYSETDFNFISRLMEHEGMYYFFEHDADGLKFVIADGLQAHQEFPHYADVPYFPVVDGQLRERDHLHQWRIKKQLQPGSFTTRDYNFESPRQDMEAKGRSEGNHPNAEFEIFNYPGGYPGKKGVPDSGNSEQLARHRIEAFAAEHEIAIGEGNAHGLAVGRLFSLSGSEISNHNKEYLLIESHCEFSQDDYRTGGGEIHFKTRVSAIGSTQQYRAPRLTPKPLMQGPQTAVVVGPAGEEIWTDQYGRVKLQFHWDRYGNFDESSSCWVRVSQSWAGQGWGGLILPRIGHEVIVEFINGDPDRPIVTGNVYNGDNMPPYNLPADAATSGLKSNTVKGGGYNEIAMNDTDQAQLLRVHAQHDMDTTVLNDQREKIGVNRTRTVGVDESVTIGNNQTLNIANNLSSTVGNNSDETVANNKSSQISNNHSTTVGSNSSLNVGGNKYETVAVFSAENIGAAKTLSIGAGYQITVGGAINTSTAVSSTEQVGGLKHIIAGSKITLSCGAASITLESGGKISIDGTALELNSSGPVKVNGAVIDLN